MRRKGGLIGYASQGSVNHMPFDMVDRFQICKSMGL